MAQIYGLHTTTQSLTLRTIPTSYTSRHDLFTFFSLPDSSQPHNPLHSFHPRPPPHHPVAPEIHPHNAFNPHSPPSPSNLLRLFPPAYLLRRSSPLTYTPQHLPPPLTHGEISRPDLHPLLDIQRQAAVSRRARCREQGCHRSTIRSSWAGEPNSGSYGRNDCTASAPRLRPPPLRRSLSHRSSIPTLAIPSRPSTHPHPRHHALTIRNATARRALARCRHASEWVYGWGRGRG